MKAITKQLILLSYAAGLVIYTWRSWGESVNTCNRYSKIRPVNDLSAVGGGAILILSAGYQPSWTGVTTGANHYKNSDTSRYALIPRIIPDVLVDKFQGYAKN